MDYRKPSLQLLLIPAFFALLFLIAFWAEIRAVFLYLIRVIGIIWPYFPFALLNDQVSIYVSGQIALLGTEEVRRGFGYLGGNCVIGAFTFIAMMIWVAQFVLPVRRLDERWSAVKRLFFYLLGLHGPAVFVKDGRILSDIKERKRTRPGVALVDLRSAIVLETSARVRGKVHDLSKDEEVDEEAPGGGSLFLFGRKKKRKRLEIEAKGPGLVFTKRRQRVHGAVDLRRQFRITPKVDAYTRDGIKVESAVYSVFSLSDEPDTFFITNIGDTSKRNPEDLRAVQVDKKYENDGSVTERVTGLYRLNPGDAEEVINYFESVDFRLDPMDSQRESAASRDPYPFDQERVTRAIYYLPHIADDKTPVEWSELPNMVVIEEFRNTVAQYAFDYMHMPDNADEFPLKKIKQEFAFKIKSKGVAKYQLVFRRDGKPVMEGQQWNIRELTRSPAQLFQTPQVLRDRGIKVVAAGFSELKPPEQVKNELINNWQARWEKEINSRLAQRDLEAARIRNQARVQAQQNVSSVLSDVLTNGQPYSKEALTLRVFQALEAAATDVSKTRLLPQDTINMLYSLYQWMLEEDGPPKDGTSSPQDNMPGGP
jgi:hypothetical protein